MDRIEHLAVHETRSQFALAGCKGGDGTSLVRTEVAGKYQRFALGIEDRHCIETAGYRVFRYHRDVAAGLLVLRLHTSSVLRP